MRAVNCAKRQKFQKCLTTKIQGGIISHIKGIDEDALNGVCPQRAGIAENRRQNVQKPSLPSRRSDEGRTQAQR